MANIIFEIPAKSFLSWRKNTRRAFGKVKTNCPMRKTEEDLLTQMLGEEESPFLTAGGTQIKPLAGEGAEIVVTAVRITTADAGYTLPVVTAGEKVLSNSLDSFETKLPECIGILLIIPAAEIGEMTLEDLMECVSSPRKVLGLWLFQYGSILYAHIKYYCENVCFASPIGKNESEFHITCAWGRLGGCKSKSVCLAGSQEVQ